jgi:hypothetical protein
VVAETSQIILRDTHILPRLHESISGVDAVNLLVITKILISKLFKNFLNNNY